MSVSERQDSKTIDTQQNNQKGLNTMHNQGKDSGIRHIYPIKHHHRNDSEMPRSRPVGSRHNHGKPTNMTNAARIPKCAVKAKQ